MAKVEITVNLPGVEVAGVEEDSNNNLLITVVTTEGSTRCRKCNRKIIKRHGDDQPRKLRHLPVFGKPCYIIYHPHRYICEFCDDHPTTTATPV